MLRLFHSNRTEALLEALTGEVARAQREAGRSPLDPLHLVVPNRNVEAYVKLGLARAHGVAAGLEAHLLRRFSRAVLAAALPDVGVCSRDELLTGLLAALGDEALLARPDLAPVRSYLDADGNTSLGARELRRFQLADELSRLYDEYALARPDMLASWERGVTLTGTPFEGLEAWQRALWLATFGPAAPGRAVAPLGEALERAAGRLALPGSEVFVFGFSYMAPIYLKLLAELARRTPVAIFTLNPCRELWEDVARDDTLDPLPLRIWGKPGREYVHAVDLLANHDRSGEPFVEPPGSTLLARLQRDLLARRGPATTERAPLAPGDDSLAILACPGPRREVEIVASEIVRFLRARAEAGERVRTDEIAVILHPRIRDEYVPHVRAVFREAQGLPFSLLDADAAGTGGAGEAALLLLDLPGSPFTRGDVLSLLTHPAVRGHGEGASAEWPRRIARVGVFHGRDRAAHEGTYLRRDVYNWDQGLLRLGLGAFMAGPRSLVEEPFERGGERYLPEEASLGEREEAGRLVGLVRSLIADAEHARTLRGTAADWARFFELYLGTYLAPETDEDRRAVARVLTAVGTLRELTTPGDAFGYTLAVALAKRALEQAPGSAGGAGVVVSSFVPMRALPFRALFLLGMGEGLFPAGDPRSALDLRQAAPRRGDVSPREGELYMFVEALLCARQRFVLSYVSRNPKTGEPLAPASVITELLAWLDEGYVAGAAAALTVEHPLRRYDPRYDEPGAPPRSVAGEASREVYARDLGRALASHTGGALLSAELLAQELPEAAYRQVASALRLPSCPREAGARRDESVALSALAALVEDPAEAYAAHRLNIEGDDDDAGLLAENDEPFDLEPLARATAARGAVDAHLCEGVPLAEALAGELERLLQSGEAPAGVLGERQRDELLTNLGQGLASLRRVTSAGGRILRLGRAREGERCAVPVEPLVFRDGERTLAVEGRASALVGSEHLVVVCNSDASKKRLARRAFVHRAALVAAGHVPPGPFEIHLLGAKDGGHQRVAFGNLGADEARAYVEALAVDLCDVPHDYYFPAEVALAVLDGRGEPQAVAEELRRKQEEKTGQKHVSFHALRRPERLPVPPDCAALAERRLGLYHRLLGEAASPSGDPSMPGEAAAKKARKKR